MTVLSQFCAEITIIPFFIFEGKELKRENNSPAFSSSIQVHSNCHSLSQTTANKCLNNNNNNNSTHRQLMNLGTGALKVSGEGPEVIQAPQGGLHGNPASGNHPSSSH